MQDHRYGLYPTDESAGISPAFVLNALWLDFSDDGGES